MENRPRQSLTICAFGDVVANVNQTERNPLDAGLERYVGLEHIEPENLHIKSWGDVGEGTSFTKVFRKGQTLFGKRRAYQRKVAYAEFEGICSGDILVFESKDPKVLLPELLPFICQTERFFQYALGTSAGSLSPRTSWTALAKYEFLLPPIEEQRRIAEILWAADEVITGYDKARERLGNLRAVYASESILVKGNSRNSTEAIENLEYVAEINPPLGMKLKDDCLVSFVTMADISDKGRITNMTIRPYKEVRKGYTSFREGDVLFAKITPCMENGKGALALNLENGVGFGSTEFHVLRPRSEEDRQFIYFVTMTSEFRSSARQTMRGSAGQLRVPADFLKDYKLMIPAQKKRVEIGKRLEAITENIYNLGTHSESAKSLQKFLVDYLLPCMGDGKV